MGIKLELGGAEELAEMIAKLRTQLCEASQTLSAAQRLCWELEVKANQPPAGTDFSATIELKNRRMSKMLTQADLANELGVSRATVAMWETGGTKPRVDMLPKLAHVLGCTIDELFREAQKEAPGPGAEG